MNIVVERDGQRREITGWRRWAIAIPVILVGMIVAVAVIVLVLGITLTLGIVLLIAVPAALILALMARLLMSRGAASPN